MLVGVYDEMVSLLYKIYCKRRHTTRHQHHHPYDKRYMSSKHLQSVSIQKIGLILNLHSDNDDEKCGMFNNF